MFTTIVLEITSLKLDIERRMGHPILRYCVGGLPAVNTLHDYFMAYLTNFDVKTT